MPHEISVLFARRDSIYKTLVADVWDADRDATKFTGRGAIIAHPPCRAWGKLVQFAKPRPGERELAIWAVDRIRENGGVLEHPATSRLWKEKGLPLPGEPPDAWGGWTLYVQQFWWGHKAQKATHLYIVGIDKSQIPPLPEIPSGQPTHMVSGDRRKTGKPGLSQNNRERTPPAFAKWLIKLAASISKMKTKTTKPSPDTSTKPKAPRQWDLARDYHEARAVSFFDDALDPDNAAKNRLASITPEDIADVKLRGIQTPVWYRIKDGKPRLIAGERRILMARAAELLTVPAFDYGKLDDITARQLANIENAQRQNLTDTEQAHSYAALVRDNGFKWWDEKNPATSVGHTFGLSRSAAYEWQAIANLDPLAAQALTTGDLKKSIAIRLSRIFITANRTTATARAIRDKWTDEEASEIIGSQYMRVIPSLIDRTDATYKCGIACEKCPYNSGAQADFIGGRSDLCGKLDCLAEKTGEAHQRKAATWPGIVWSQKQAIAAGLRKDEWSGTNCLSADYCNLDSTAEFYRIPGYKPKKKTLRENLGDDLKAEEIILTITNDGKNTSLEIIPLALAKKLLQKRGHIKAPVEKTPSPADKERDAKTARADAIRAEIARLIVASAEEMAEHLKLKPADHMLELHRIAIAIHIRSIGTWNLKEIVARRQAEKTDLRYGNPESFAQLITDKTRTKPPELLGILAEIYTQPDGITDNVEVGDWDDEAIDFIHWLELDLQTLITTATATIDAKGVK
jgi:ParB/RepB/Spo0J family partition protein